MFPNVTTARISHIDFGAFDPLNVSGGLTERVHTLGQFATWCAAPNCHWETLYLDARNAKDLLAIACRFSRPTLVTFRFANVSNSGIARALVQILSTTLDRPYTLGVYSGTPEGIDELFTLESLKRLGPHIDTLECSMMSLAAARIFTSCGLFLKLRNVVFTGLIHSDTINHLKAHAHTIATLQTIHFHAEQHVMSWSWTYNLLD